MLIYIGKGCACMRTLCDFIFISNISIDENNHSNMFVTLLKLYNAALVIEPLLHLISHFNLTIYCLPTLEWILHYWRNNTKQWPVLTARTCPRQWTQNSNHCSTWYTRDTPYLEKIEDGDGWMDEGWRTPLVGNYFFGWSLTATGIFNLMLYPVLILLTLALMHLLLITILYIKLHDQTTQLQPPKTCGQQYLTCCGSART